MRSIDTLLAGLVDYAGLFPPAQLDVPSAIANYARYVAGPDRATLGRFVVPAARLGEVATAARDLVNGDGPWRLSAIAGGDLAADARAIEEHNARHGDRLLVDAIELKASTAEEIRRSAASFGTLTRYIELPIGRDVAELVAAVADAGARAKVRTGGVAVEAFPTPLAVARFLHACVGGDLPFKATAGLHHPMRGSYRLTYEPDAASGTMFGFLNVFLAAAFLRAGLKRDDAVTLLEERSPEALRFDDDGVTWRDNRLTTGDIARSRERAIAFGSCSFEEPVGEVKGLYGGS